MIVAIMNIREAYIRSRCLLCDINSIQSKLRPLCWGCYATCKRAGLLHLFPLKEQKERMVERAIRKHGIAFVQDLQSKRTLQSIGVQYGLSRERIRQIRQILLSENTPPPINKIKRKLRAADGGKR